jgi:hypothetical protein
MEITMEYLNELEKLDYTMLHKSLNIVNTLLDDSIRKEIIPINNIYELTLTPLVKELLTDWIDLWTPKGNDNYEIMGNTVHIKTGDKNFITKI